MYGTLDLTRGEAILGAIPHSGKQAMAVLAVLSVLWPLWSTAAAADTPGSPPPPGHVLELVQTGAVEIMWSPASDAAPAQVTSYDVAPVVGGAACPSCRSANTVGAGTTSLELGSLGGTVATYAVRAVGGTGASTWVTAQLPGEREVPAGASPEAVGGGVPWVAQPVDAAYTSPLDTAPPGWSRTVVRDDGYSAPTANDGDLWVFADTTVIDSPDSGTTTQGPVSCVTQNGTAAVAPPALPPHLEEALQPLSTAIRSGTAQCTGDTTALPATTNEPYQLLGDYPGPSPGVTCSNWVNGLTNELDPSGQLSDAVLASYGSACLNGSDEIVGSAGMWATQYQLTSSSTQTITMALGPASTPDLPAVTCPAGALSSYDGGSQMAGNYSSALDFDGYDYFYAPYGNSAYAWAALGIPETACSAMALARVPAGDDPGGVQPATSPADYQYLLPGGQWETPAQAGLPAPVLAGESANIMPAGYDGAYAGEVDVSQLATGELAMVYELQTRFRIRQVAPMSRPDGPVPGRVRRVVTGGPRSASGRAIRLVLS